MDRYLVVWPKSKDVVHINYHYVKNPTVESLSRLNRKTYKNYNVEGVSPEQLISLTKNPYEYERILNTTQKEIC